MSSEPTGRINILSQDCFASPGVLVAGVGGVGVGLNPNNPDLVVSSLTTQLSGVSTFTTPNLLITELINNASVDNVIGITVIPDINFGNLESLDINFATLANISEDVGIMTINVSENAAPFIEILYLSTVQSEYAKVYTDAQMFPDFTAGCSSVVGVSSINGVSWAQISTVAANY